VAWQQHEYPHPSYTGRVPCTARYGPHHLQGTDLITYKEVNGAAVAGESSVTVPAVPSTAATDPSAMRWVASGTLTTAGTPYSRATIAPWEIGDFRQGHTHLRRVHARQARHQVVCGDGRASAPRRRHGVSWQPCGAVPRDGIMEE
jgi:hypothetical protein